MTKVVMFLGILLFGFRAHSFELFEDEYRLSPLKGRILSVEPFCPSGAAGKECALNEKKVKIEFGLLGCKDRLGPVSYKVSHGHGNVVDIYVTAMNIHHILSERTFCFLRPTRIFTITLLGDKFWGPREIRLHNLNQAPR